jgi:site-specific recombinase XerC
LIESLPGLRLAALRHFFDWMVIGQIMPINPASAVRGPRHIVRRGKTPVLDPAEARQRCSKDWC